MGGTRLHNVGEEPLELDPGDETHGTLLLEYTAAGPVEHYHPRAEGEDSNTPGNDVLLRNNGEEPLELDPGEEVPATLLFDPRSDGENVVHYSRREESEPAYGPRGEK